MNRRRTIVLSLAFVLAGGFVFAQTNDLPKLPPPRSPVDTFRELLNMTSADRMKALESRTPETRQKLTAKIQEYQKLTPDERELRLRATELRWWLLSLMRQPTSNHLAAVRMVPEHLREPITNRLSIWALIPEPLQKEFLDTEDIRQLYERIQGLPAAQREKILKSLPPERQQALEAGLDRWMRMDPNERQKAGDRIEQYFTFSPRERQKVLGTLSETERQQMEKTLKSFETLPVEQRRICVRSFQKFASMSAGERQQFLKKAEQWEKMSPGERQAWRNLVNNVETLPPLPADFYENAPPPLPPGLGRARIPAAATNSGG